MIVRILGEPQLNLPDSALVELGGLELTLQHACAAGEHDAFAAALTSLLTRVRALGEPVAADFVGPTDLVLPSADASLAEVSELIGDEGLIPT